MIDSTGGGPDIRANPPCPTRLISDTPADEDAFGPHQAAAQSIVQMIQSEPGGQTIGICGRWGAGKSTVISLLKKGIATSPSSRVWVFDAWSHEGDPLRRTFLESLILFLSASAWVSAQPWRKRAEELARRRKETDQWTYPRLSILGWLLAASALLIPLGTALFSYGLRNGVISPWVGGDVDWGFVIGLPLTLSPLITLGVALAVLQVRRWRGKSLRADESYLAEFFSLFVQRTVTQTRTETIETPEPTSIEFEATFQDLMKEALAATERRLVLVIDNLDRVAPSDALRIWSNLQTFVQHGADRPTWLERLWVVIPFDPESLSKLWEQSRERAAGLASSFLDKTFQVRIDVPAPLMSDWRDYLVRTLHEALPRHSELEFHRIHRLFALRRRAATDAPTPREIKILVNQIGAIHRQRGDTVPITHVAYYVVLRRLDIDVLSDLLDGKLPLEGETGLLGEGVRDNLAALAFGVEARKARQLLLEGPILEALGTPASARLRDLRKATDGFDDALEQALSRAGSDWPKAEGGKLLHAVVALSESGFLETEGGYRTDVVLQTLRQSAEKVETITPLTGQVGEGILTLVAKVGELGLARHLFQAYANAVAKVEAERIPEVANHALELLQGLDRVGLGESSKGGITIPGSLDVYVGALGVLGDRKLRVDSPYWRSLKTTVPADQVAPYLQQIISQGKLRSPHYLAIRALSQQMPGVPWGQVAAVLRNRLNSSNSIRSDELTPCIVALIALGGDPTADQLLLTLLTEGHLAHHIFIAFSERDMNALASCLFLYMSRVPSLQPQGQVNQSPQGYSLITQFLTVPPEGLPEALAKLLWDYRRQDVLLAVLDANAAARPLVGKTLTALLGLDAGSEFFTPALTVQRWEVLREYVDLPTFLKRIDGDGGLTALVRSGDFRAEHASLYRSLLEHGSRTSELAEWCADGLRALSAAAWVTGLEVRADTITLLLLCAHLGVPLNLSQSLRDALRSHAEKLARGSVTSSLAHEEWAGIFGALDPSERVVMRDQLYDVLRDNVNTVNAIFFEAYGDELAGSDALRHDTSIITRVLEPLLVQRNAAGLTWLRERLGDGAELLQVAKAEHQKAFKTRLAEAARASTSDVAGEQIVAIASALGVSIGDRDKRGET